MQGLSLARRRIPAPCRTIGACRHQPCIVARERDERDLTSVSAKHPNELAGFGVPHANQAVRACSRQVSAIVAEVGVPDEPIMRENSIWLRFCSAPNLGKV